VHQGHRRRQGMNALRRWLHALFTQVFADLGVLLRSLE
jgi:hypothetical protein